MSSNETIYIAQSIPVSKMFICVGFRTDHDFRVLQSRSVEKLCNRFDATSLFDVIHDREKREDPDTLKVIKNERYVIGDMSQLENATSD